MTSISANSSTFGTNNSTSVTAGAVEDTEGKPGTDPNNQIDALFKGLCEEGFFILNETNKDSETTRIKKIISNILTAANQAGVKDLNAISSEEFRAILKNPSLTWEGLKDDIAKKFFEIFMNREVKTLSIKTCIFALNWAGESTLKISATLPPLENVVDLTHSMLFPAEPTDDDLAFLRDWRGCMSRKQCENTFNKVVLSKSETAPPQRIFRFATGGEENAILEGEKVTYYRNLVLSTLEKHEIQLKYDVTKETLTEATEEVRSKYRRRGQPQDTPKKNPLHARLKLLNSVNN